MAPLSVGSFADCPNGWSLVFEDDAIDGQAAAFYRSLGWVVAVSRSVTAMDAPRARIRAQSKTVADHLAAAPEAKGFIDDWATPEPITPQSPTSSGRLWWSR